jgi:uncharacterized membrane protein YoaK (UPF0700 family)
MKPVIMQTWRTVVPARGDRDGPLVPMLIALTVVSGMVDAFSFLYLGHIFVANLTGDVLFVAFGLAGAQGFSISALLVTLGTFFFGALVGGRLYAGIGRHRGRLLAVVCIIQAALFAASVIVASMGHQSSTGGSRYAILVLLALAMGVQNAMALKLEIPGLTTSVLTRTITGISADSRLGGGTGATTGARIASTAALFLGALVGAALVLNVNAWSELLVATAILVAVSLIAAALSRSNPPWVHATQPR